MAEGRGDIFDVDGVLIDGRTTAHHATRVKPVPQFFPLAAVEFQLPVDRCCIVEDAPAGILAAHRAEIVCNWLASTGRRRSELEAAECVFDERGELSPRWIRQLIQSGLQGTTVQE